jgi:predicted amidohydrolase
MFVCSIKPHDQVWEHLFVARAVENQVFVCSVNNAAPPQKLTSYLVAPSGDILLRAKEQTEQLLSYEMDLREVGREIF